MNKEEYSLSNPAKLEVEDQHSTEMASPGKRLLILSLAFHGLFLLHHAYTGCVTRFQDFSKFEDPMVLQMGKFAECYYTVWNFGAQLLFLILAATVDFSLILKKSHYSIIQKTKRWTDLAFTAIVVPNTTVIFLIFWPFFIYDRELLFPKAYDLAISAFNNHSMHSVIMLVVIFEAVLEPRQRPKTHKTNLCFLAAFVFAYAIVFFMVYYEFGVWIYPIGHRLGVYWTLGLAGVIIIPAVFLVYFLQWPFYRFLRHIESRMGRRFKKDQQTE